MLWTVQTIKTLYGRKWAVANEKGELANYKTKTGVAVFDYTPEGFELAKKAVQKIRGEK